MTISASISSAFICIVFTTVFIFYIASCKNKKALFTILVVLLLQGTLAYYSFYSAQPLVPSKIPLVVAPSFIILFFALFSRAGQRLVGVINLSKLTLLHTIRIPVEIILYVLCLQKAIPIEMTFEGRNFDILAGITAPIIYYFTFVKNKLGRASLLIWNIVSLLLLINIIATAVLSLELPFQQFGIEQANHAILFFPFIWLPSVVVPLVFFSHLVAIKRLLHKS